MYPANHIKNGGSPYDDALAQNDLLLIGKKYLNLIFPFILSYWYQTHDEVFDCKQAIYPTEIVEHNISL